MGVILSTHQEKEGKTRKKGCVIGKVKLYKVLSEKNVGQIIGDHETQQSEGGEAYLYKYHDVCEKNPGHKEFISIDDFTLKHLPDGYQDNELYEYIKVIAEQTVRVDVKMTSRDRPKFWPKTRKRYPFYKVDDKRKLRTGSGRFWHPQNFEKGMTQNGERSAHTKCWCRKCQDLDSASNVWWEFSVTTARHVVFDDTEASHTSLRMFYDRDVCPVVMVDMVTVLYVDTEYDWCMLKCVTCDTNIGSKVMKIWKLFENVSEKVWSKYETSSFKNNLSFIVSHPHGCSKQISIGEWAKEIKVGYRTKFIYTTCTCPGSSGAHVQCVGYDDWGLSDHVHCGSLMPGLNYSGAGHA